MEGQKPKIRTMAQDLERVRSVNKPALQGPAPSGAGQEKKEIPPASPRRVEAGPPPHVPEVPPRAAQVSKEAKADQKAPVVPDVERQDARRLSEILRTARKRMEEGEKKPEPKEKAAMPPKTLADLLPIEIEPRDSAIKPEGQEVVVRVEAKSDLAEAPAMAGVGSPSRGQGPLQRGEGPPPNLPTGADESAVPKGPGEAAAPAKVEVQPPLEGGQRKTPEELLGLPAKSAAVPPPEKIQEEEKTIPEKKDLQELFAKRRPEGRASPLAGTAQGPAPDGAGQRLKEKVRTRALPAFKFSLAMGILGLVLVVIGGGIYWNFFLRGKDPQVTSPEPARDEVQPQVPLLAEPTIPQALIDYDKVEVIEVGEATYDVLKSQIDGFLYGDFFPETFVYVPVKSSTDIEIKYLTLSELLTALQIDAPSPLHTSDYRNFSLFLYAPGEEEREVCSEAGIVDASCYGPRMGLVVKISDRDTVFSLMREWEETLVSDLAPLILGSPQQRAGDTFSLGRYGDVTTHFINLPVSSLSIDWIVTEEYLIIATSKNAARRAVDKLR